MHNVGNPELLQIADAVAREKSIGRDAVLDAMEQAIQVAGRRKYGFKHNIKAEINKRTGEAKLYRVYEVVEKIDDSENVVTQISLEDALYHNPKIKVGEFIQEELPPIDLGRVAAQSAKQVIVQKVKEVESDRQYKDFKDRVGEIVNGVVKQNEYGNIIIDIGRDEAVLFKDKVIPGESFRQGDRIRCYIENVKKSSKGHQIFLSRTHDMFLAGLFSQEVPEIYDRVIEIKSVSREPGSKAKVAVFSSDSSIDAVGSCVGVRGARVQAVINELHGEKIDVIQWSADPATFVISALSPASVAKVVIDEVENRIEAVVPTDQLSLAIGKKGQNVRLASKLLNWRIDVLTEEEESRRRQEEFSNATKLFMEALDVEEVIAQLLAAEGYHKVEEVAYVNSKELLSIEGFENEIVQELSLRAKNYLSNKYKEVNEKIDHLGVDKQLRDIVCLSPDKMLLLAEKGIKKIEDLAEISVNEFIQILPNSGLSPRNISVLLNKAKHYSENE